MAAKNLEWCHTSADLSFICNDNEITHIIQAWADGHDMHMPAMSMDDVGQKGFEKVIIELRLQRAETTAWIAYPAEMTEAVDEEAHEEPKEHLMESKMKRIREINLRPEVSWLKKKR